MNEWFEAEKHVEKAHEYYESGRWEEALNELSKALNVNPYQGEWHFNMGLTLEAMGRYEEAGESFRKAIECEGDKIEILIMYATNCLRLDRFEESIAIFERAEKLDPSDEATYIRRIEAYAGLGDHEMAEEMFYLAIEFDTDNAEAYFNIAVSLLERGEIDRAIFCWNKVLEIEPTDDQVFSRLAHAYWLKGELEKSYRYFLEQVRRVPGDVESLLDMGNLLSEMSRPIEAAEKYRRVAELDPANSEAHYHLGRLAMVASHLDAAQLAFERSLSLKPERPDAHQKLAVIAMRRKRMDEARDHLQREFMIGANLKKAVKARELGQLMMEANMPHQATEVYLRVMRLRPAHPEVLLEAGVAHLMAGLHQPGMKCCRKALKLNGKLHLAMYNLALASLQLDQLKRASYWVNKGIKVDRKNKRLKQLRSKIRMQIVRSRLRKLIGRG